MVGSLAWQQALEGLIALLWLGEECGQALLGALSCFRQEELDRAEVPRRSVGRVLVELPGEK